MYLLPFFLLPIVVPALSAWFPKADPKPFSKAVLGFVAGLPAALVWFLARGLYEPAYGGALLVLSFTLRYFLVPGLLYAAALALTLGFRSLERGTGYRDLVNFSLGFYAALSAVFALAEWGVHYYGYTLILPLLTAGTALGSPLLMEESVRDGMPDGIKWIAAALGAYALGATALALLFLRLEWLGLILGAGYAAGGAVMGIRKLSRVR